MNRLLRTALILLVVASTAPAVKTETVIPEDQDTCCNTETGSDECQAVERSAPEPGTPEEEGEKPAKGAPVAQQWMPDAHAGLSRATANARLMLRLPGLAPVPGLHNHGLLPWLEWQMDQARLASASMAVIAPDISPHAPPRTHQALANAA